MRKVINESRLGEALHQIFPSSQIARNVRKSADLISPTTGRHLEVDFWLPNFNLAFEFQEEYHFASWWYSIDFRTVQHKDNIKKEMLKAKGTTLVTVPYWWDGSKESLHSTILLQRPDLGTVIPSLHSSPPIPPCPTDVIHTESSISTIGKLPSIPFLQPSFVNELLSPGNEWWLSEKYDGIRIWWVEANKQLYNHVGSVISVLPTYFREFNSTVEGYLWMGRGNGAQLHKTIHSQNNDYTWCYLRFIESDCPNTPVNLHFEDRYRLLFNQIEYNREPAPFRISLVYMKWKQTQQQLKSVLCDNILNNDGEGIQWQKSRSMYSDSLTSAKLKVSWNKQVLPQTNADPEQCLNRLNGISRKVHRALAEKLASRSPPLLSPASSPSLPLPPLISSSHHQRGYWTSGDCKNLRAFFDSFALRHQLGDPLSPSTWYHASTSSLKLEAPFIRHHYYGSIEQALEDAYPDLELLKGYIDKGLYWFLKQTKKNFFDQLARSRNFNPTSEDHKWHSVTVEHLLSEKGAEEILAQYGGSIVMALRDVYPNLQLCENDFNISRNWAHPKRYQKTN